MTQLLKLDKTIQRNPVITLAEEIDVTLWAAEGVRPRHRDQRGHQLLIATAEGALRQLVSLLDRQVGVVQPLELVGDGMIRAGHILDELKQVLPQQLGVVADGGLMGHDLLSIVSGGGHVEVEFEMLGRLCHIGEVVGHCLITLTQRLSLVMVLIPAWLFQSRLIFLHGQR